MDGPTQVEYSLDSQLSFQHVMPKVACIDLPALPLQLVIRRHPEWRDDPLVVVETDRPTAKVLWVNRHARALNIQRGLSFSQAKTLAARLRAQVVSEVDVQRAVEELFDVILNYTPAIEPVPHTPGLFFADPNGLGGLFGDLNAWATQLHQTLKNLNYVPKIAVGFSRPWLYTLCRSQRDDCHISPDPEAERAQAMRVPLVQLHLSPTQLKWMDQLGIHTVGAFTALPAGDIRTRYGHELSTLHAFLNGRCWTPLQPYLPPPPLQLTCPVDPPDVDMTRLLFGLKSQVQQAVAQLGPKTQAIIACTVQLHMEYPSVHLDNAAKQEMLVRIETAAPTLDVLQIIELLRLRLSQLRLNAPVNEITMDFEHVRVHPKQLQLEQQRKRDMAAANRALARIKAMLSDEAVTRAQLRPGHLPEAQFSFESCSNVSLPTPRFTAQLMPLVRSISPKPKTLPRFPGPSREQGLNADGSLRQCFGPYRIAGGWWAQSTERDYYFTETRSGEVLWVFYDRVRRRWSMHGVMS